jgi:sugar phosphate isomerase/epimerase
VGWTDQLEQLAAHGFKGPISLEIYLEPRPKEGLRTATTLIHMIRDVRAQAEAE